MKLTIELFAQARQAAGISRIDVDLEEGARIADLREAIVRAFPQLRETITSSRLAVNRAYADEDTSIHAGDEIAVIPPVSGGH